MKRILPVFFLLCCLFLPPGVVQADIAPPQPPVGANLLPGGAATNVRMMSEKVTIDVAAHNAHPTGDAAITASFEMRNLGQETEKMNVRFPLCKIGQGDGGSEWNGIPKDYAYPPIDHFTASVNGRDEPVFTTPVSDSADKTPCWANFAVVFPPNQDVPIQVGYHQIGYNGFEHGVMDNYVIYSYILFTCAAWKGNIGSADVIVKLPVPANSGTVYGSPDNATLSVDEIRWHADDFKPDADNGVLSFSILQPAIGLAIEKESANVSANPKDGEAWGRLGKAYKQAALMEHGWRDDAAGLDLAQKGMDAYQHAVDLLPKDADWHYGYAELVCSDVFWKWVGHSAGNETRQLEYNRICVDQLNMALKLNPKQEAANQLKQELASGGLIVTEDQDGQGAIVDYPLLTPWPTGEATQAEVGLPLATPIVQPLPAMAVTLTTSPAPLASGTPTPRPPAPAATLPPVATAMPQSVPLCGGAGALVILVLLLVWFRH